MDSVIADFNPSGTFRALYNAHHVNKDAPEVEALACDLTSRVASAQHSHVLCSAPGPFPGLCVAQVPTDRLGRYKGVAVVLDEYGLELRFKRLEHDRSKALVWVCPGKAGGSGPFAGASVGERRALVLPEGKTA